MRVSCTISCPARFLPVHGSPIQQEYSEPDVELLDCDENCHASPPLKQKLKEPTLNALIIRCSSAQCAYNDMELVEVRVTEERTQNITSEELRGLPVLPFALLRWHHGTEV